MKTKQTIAVFSIAALLFSLVPTTYISAAGSKGISFDSGSEADGFTGSGETELKIETDYTQVAAPEDIGFSVKVPKAITFHKDMKSVDFDVTTELNDGTDAADVPRNGFDLTVSASRENTVTNLTNEGEDITVMVVTKEDASKSEVMVNKKYVPRTFQFNASVPDDADFKDEYEGSNITWSISFSNNRNAHVHDFSVNAGVLLSSSGDTFDLDDVSFPEENTPYDTESVAELRLFKKCNDDNCYTFQRTTAPVIPFSRSDAVITCRTDGTGPSGCENFISGILVPSSFTEETVSVSSALPNVPSGNKSLPIIVTQRTTNLFDHLRPDSDSVVWSAYLLPDMEIFGIKFGTPNGDGYYYYGTDESATPVGGGSENSLLSNSFLVLYTDSTKSMFVDDLSHGVKIYEYSQENIDNHDMKFVNPS